MTDKPDFKTMAHKITSQVLDDDEMTGLLDLPLRIAAALQSAYEAGEKARTAVGFDTLVCLNCSHIGAPPPPPYLSCCPERKAVRFCDLAGMVASVAAERERCAGIAINGCLVPPDGGSPTGEERAMCEGIAAAIRGQKP